MFPLRHTLFTHTEELVCIPGHNTTRKSSPAPLCNAAQNLSHISLNPKDHELLIFTIGSVRRSSCVRYSPCNACPLSKKFLINVRAALGSDVGRNGRSMNGISSARMRNILACVTLTCTCMSLCMMGTANLPLVRTS